MLLDFWLKNGKLCFMSEGNHRSGPDLRLVKVEQEAIEPTHCEALLGQYQALAERLRTEPAAGEALFFQRNAGSRRMEMVQRLEHHVASHLRESLPDMRALFADTVADIAATREAIS